MLVAALAAGACSLGAQPGAPALQATAVTPCATPHALIAAPAGLAATHVAVSFQDPTAKIVDTSDRFLVPLGNTFIVSAEGEVAQTGYKGTQGPRYEDRVSASGAVLAARKDWQVRESPNDNTVFVLGGVGDNWSWVDGDGKAHRLAPDWNYQPVVRDTAGHIWAVRYTPSRDLLMEFDTADPAATPTTVDFGGNRIYNLVPGCDGAIWVITESGSLMRIADGVRTEVARLTFGQRFNTPATIPASDGSLWLLSYHSTGDFTGYSEITRYATSGPIGKAVTIAEDEPFSGVVGPDGALWAKAVGGVYRVGLDGSVHAYQLSTSDQPAYASNAELAFGPEGHLWYVCGARAICSIALRPAAA